MFERIGAGAHRVAGAARAIRVDGDFLAVRVRHVHRGLHLVEREGLIGVDVVEAANRSEHLDDVRARRVLFAYPLHHLGTAIPLAVSGPQPPARTPRPAPEAQPLPGRKDPWSFHGSTTDQSP